MTDFWGERRVPPVCSGGLWAAWPRQEVNRAGIHWCEWPVPVGRWQSWSSPGSAAMGGVKRKSCCKPAGKTRDGAARECWGTTRLTPRKHIAPKWQEPMKLPKPYQSPYFPSPRPATIVSEACKKPFFTFGMWTPVTAFRLKVLVEIEWEFQDVSLSSIMSFRSETPWL